MNTRSYSIIFSALTIVIQSCFPMDVEPTESGKPYLPGIPNPSGQEYVSTLPLDVIRHILKFIIEADPDAVGNLAKIQEVCKELAGLLSKDEMKWILELDQKSLNDQVFNALRKIDPKNLQLLINLGAQFEKDTIINTPIIWALDSHNQKKETISRLLNVIAILEKAGATWKLIDPYMLTYAINTDNTDMMELLIKYITPDANHLITVIKKSENLRLTQVQNQQIKVKMAQFLIDHGADVNEEDENGNVPLMYVSTPEMAKTLLEAGASLFVDCHEKTPLKSLVDQARYQKNPMILIQVLKTRYPYQTALAIATALMAGAPYISAMCNIL